MSRRRLSASNELPYRPICSHWRTPVVERSAPASLTRTRRHLRLRDRRRARVRSARRLDPVDPAVATATVDAAWAGGIRHFDTAPHYGAGLSETRLGSALATRPREAFTLSTKMGRILVDHEGTWDIWARPTAKPGIRLLLPRHVRSPSRQPRAPRHRPRRDRPHPRPRRPPRRSPRRDPPGPHRTQGRRAHRRHRPRYELHRSRRRPALARRFRRGPHRRAVHAARPVRPGPALPPLRLTRRLW